MAKHKPKPKDQKAQEASTPKSKSMRDMLWLYVKSGKAGIQITSFEETRVELEIKSIAAELKFRLYSWSITQGMVCISDDPPTAQPETNDPVEMLDQFQKAPVKSILVAKDLHLFLGDAQNPNPMLVRKIKDTIKIGTMSNRVLILCGCRANKLLELEKELALLEYRLPDKDQLNVVLEGIATSAGVVLDGNRGVILDAASGLTTQEASDAFAMSVAECGDIKPEVVSREKGMTVKKGGLLEVVDTPITLDDIGGLDLYKEHLWSISKCFTQQARDYGLPSPRPVICCGQPGTAKSMSSMACRNVFGLPLLRLEAGKLFGSLVGQSEDNWRCAFGTAKAIAPAIFWIDEAEGLFSGMASSGQTDGGTTQRVVKAILQDMQFNGDGLFFVFTSNDIDHFPDPLIDRCDVWNFELPVQREREAIWRIHIAKRRRNPDKFDVPRLADNTEGYSGRQIEQVWCKALTISFNDGMREPNGDDVDRALTYFVPTSVTMKDAIERRRQRLKSRARAASTLDVVPVSDKRKLA